MIIGNNTLVSHYSIPGGIPSFSPFNALREGKKRGVKIICIDPRETEVAARSDLHLQVKPGQKANSGNRVTYATPRSSAHE